MNQFTHQIHGASDQMIPHTRTILTPSPTNKHYTMLLNIVTLPRNIARNNSAGTQSHPCCLSLCRIWLLWLGDPNLDTDAFERWCVHIV